MTKSQAKMTEIATSSPAYNRQRIDGDNGLRELPWVGKISLRGDPGNKEFLTKVKQVLECDLPTEANTLTKQESVTIYWLGPDEWLIHCEIDEVSAVMNKLKSKLTEIHHAVVDVSDYYTVLQLEGPEAITLLSKGCPLDIRPDSFQPSNCAQTRFGHASILLHKLDNTPVFNIQIRWSYTEYVWDYLVSAISTLES